jgi:hypothetical protein
MGSSNPIVSIRIELNFGNPVGIGELMFEKTMTNLLSGEEKKALGRQISTSAHKKSGKGRRTHVKENINLSKILLRVINNYLNF